jgi:hypothetical protein
MKAFEGALKMKKKRSWKRLSENCEDRDPCDCGETMMCRHADSTDDVCDKASCPIWNKSGNCSHTKV